MHKGPPVERIHVPVEFSSVTETRHHKKIGAMTFERPSKTNTVKLNVLGGIVNGSRAVALHAVLKVLHIEK